MYVGFKDYNNLPKFLTFEDCNEFVNKWATRDQDFKLKHEANLVHGKLFSFSFIIEFLFTSSIELVSEITIIFSHLANIFYFLKF